MYSVENRTTFKRTNVVCANNETDVISITIGRFRRQFFFFIIIEKHAATHQQSDFTSIYQYVEMTTHRRENSRNGRADHRGGIVKKFRGVTPENAELTAKPNGLYVKIIHR